MVKALARPARKSVKAKPRTKSMSSASKARKAATKPKSAPKARAKGTSASQRISDRGNWREETLARIRALIMEADPAMIEERKWRKPSNGMVGVPVWSHHGIVCTGEMYAKAVKLTFARGAFLPDPSRLFTSSLEGNLRRAIDIPEGAKVDVSAFQALVKAAVVENAQQSKKR